MPRWLKLVFLVLVLALIGIQFVPVKRTNPPVTAALQAPLEVQALFRRSCYDCHSNETRWPWYSRVAPVSWRVSRHVEVGRSELNFSEWASYPAPKQAHKAEEISDEIQKGKMPLKDYLRLHRDAKLTPEEINTLVAWTRSVRGLAPGEAASESDEEHEGNDH